MKILLYNDNPVVRKLVALSAQKTKDELNVIWSIDELDDGAYDLLIVDDALYSDDVVAELKARVPFKTTLMMATRGSSVPAGFDKVIHKPFLPTDLVDLFSQIEKTVSAPSAGTVPKDQGKAINLEDAMEEMDDMGSLDDLPDLGSLEFEDGSSGITTNILDHEEVQEVQSLLDEEDAFVLDEPMDGIEGLDDLSGSESDDLLEGLGEIPDISSMDDIGDTFDQMEDEKNTIEDDSLLMPEMDEFEGLNDEVLEAEGIDDLLAEVSIGDEPFDGTEGEEDLDALMVGLDEEMMPEAMEEAPLPAEFRQMDEEEFDMDEEISFNDADLDEITAASIEDETLLDEEGMDELEQQIQDAVGDLELGDLSMELGEEELDELGIEPLNSLEGLDGLESINEREMKLAVGESVEDEPEEDIVEGGDELVDPDTLSEAMEDDQDTVLPVKEEEPCDGSAPSSAEGVEALQVLLKTLSNEEVVKSLKGLNISININFGNNA